MQASTLGLPFEYQNQAWFISSEHVIFGYQLQRVHYPS